MSLGKTQGVTSPKDRSGLKERWMGLSEEQLNAVEAESIFRAQKKYLFGSVPSPLKWFNLSFLFRVHKEMLFFVWEWAGRKRNGEKNIGVKPYLIESQLENLCRDVIHWNSVGSDLPVLEQACAIHHRLVYIHPFEDGNGRFSRLIADRYLKAHRASYPIWPNNLHQDNGVRQDYINSLREADLGNLELLVDFSKRYGALER